MLQGVEYDALIVGGGHNALTSAGYLAKAGYKVVIVIITTLQTHDDEKNLSKKSGHRRENVGMCLIF